MQTTDRRLERLGEEVEGVRGAEGGGGGGGVFKLCKKFFFGGTGIAIFVF